VFAEGDRLLVLIGGDMPDGENRHCNPMIRLWIACSKLEGEGKADQFKGKVQDAVGGLKDTLRGK
jgi:hypothetical protein